MNKGNFWAFMFIAGLAIGGISLWLSEARFLDDRIKYPESTFQAIITSTNWGMGIGGFLIVAGLGIGFATQWGKKHD